MSKTAAYILSLYSIGVTIVCVVLISLVSRARLRILAFKNEHELKRAYAKSKLKENLNDKDVAELVRYLHDEFDGDSTKH